MEEDDENNKWLCGLKYATELGFTHAEFKEAIKRIKTPDVANANQLLVALIDVSIRDDTTTISNNLPANGNIINTTTSNNNINVNASTCCPPSNQSAADVVGTGFATTPTTQTQTNTVDVKVTSSSAHSQGRRPSLSTPTSSSCYSSYPTSSSSALSSSDQSLESLQQATLTLRKVYIDGSNVARSYRKDAIFSWLGIKLCVDWFVRRHHRVKVFVPRDKCQQADESVFRYLDDLDALVQTPTGHNDDLLIIQAARLNDGVIVSNDLFRDEKRFDNEMQNFIHLHRLPYVFVDETFLPIPDPLGRTGPTLDEFLTNSPEQLAQKSYHPPPTKSHQKYQFSKNNYSMKQRQNYNLYHQSNLLTRSLPMERSPTMANDINSQISVASSGQHQSHSQNHYHYYQHQHQLKIQKQVHRKAHNHGHQRQQVGRAISVACATPSGTTKDEETRVVGGRSVLCRTKSHNI